MYIIIWEFEVAPGRAAEFQFIYSPQGEWAQLFGQAQGYLGTELLQSSESPTRFLTIDRWKNSQDFAIFRQRWNEQYASLDERCEGMTLSERKLGAFLEGDLQ
jgi:heme-degrading monooxygenase HmoA